MRFEVGNAAIVELDEAARYYRSIDPLLATDLAEAIEETFDDIRSLPLRDPSDTSGVRKRLIRRFLYHIVYFVNLVEIHVLAFAHARRRPDYWRSRIQ